MGRDGYAQDVGHDMEAKREMTKNGYVTRLLHTEIIGLYYAFIIYSLAMTDIIVYTYY